jgi:CRISPR-associated protein Csx17
MTRHVLAGLRPTPLGGYLAGLGLFRALAEQADPLATARWTDTGLVIETAVNDLAGWLVDRYVPTPVLSPWNEGSGFGTKDRTPKVVLDKLLALPQPRLDGYRAALPAATAVASRYRSPDAGWSKERAVREFRNTCPDELVPWIDATVVLANAQGYFPPLLGSGGNDGRLDFSTTFHQRLLEVLDPAPRFRRRSEVLAADLLSGAQTERLQAAAIGQFDPAAAGGSNSSPFGGANSLVNPWGYLLLVEGALLFAASAVRRHQHGTGRAAIPFTVTASPDGSASGAASEASRGEVWAPIWERPFTLAEVQQLFAEARATWNGRPAQRAVEFYAATRSLGIARGVDSFIRYGLYQRNGLAFVAIPVEQVRVQSKPEVRLAARLEEWISRVRRADSSTAVTGTLRRFDTANMVFARDGGPDRLGDLLAAVTDLEMSVGRSGRAKDVVPVRRPPSAADFLETLVNAECAELRVAAGIASCATRAGTDRQRARTMRHLLLPVDPDGTWRDSPVVPGLATRSLTSVLADVLTWRCRTAADETDTTHFRGAPTFRYGIPVPAADLYDLTLGRLDATRLDRWLRACLALNWHSVSHEWRDADRTPDLPVTTVGLLHALAAGIAPDGAGATVPRLALDPDWAPRLAAGRVTDVHNEAVRRLRQAGWQAVPLLAATGVDGTAIAAAVVPRCRRPTGPLARYFAISMHVQNEQQTLTATPETEEVTA